MRRGLLIIILLILIGYFILGYGGKGIEEVSNVNFDDISRIVFYDGRGGRFEPLALDDKQKIEEFLNLLEKYRIKKVEVVEPSAGWSHKAVFFKADERIFDITFVNPIIINGEYYKITSQGLSTETIDDFLSPLR